MRQSRAQALTYGLGLLALGTVVVLVARKAQRRQPRPVFDYSARSGLRQPAEQMRGAAVGRVRQRLLGNQLLDDRPRALERHPL